MKTIPVDSEVKLTPVDFDPFGGGSLLAIAPVTEPQKEIWLPAQMGDDANCAYNESMSLRLRGTLDVDALRSSFEKLVRRHDAMRTTFSPDGEILCIAESIALEVPLVDISNMGDRDRDIALADIWKQEVKQPFDLVRGPLFRAKIVKCRAKEHIAILTGHHIVCDGWSWGVLIPDLAALYSALRKGVAADLPNPERFSEYAILQEQQAKSPEYIAAQQYWVEQFSGQIPVLDLPLDRPRPGLRTYNGDRVDWEVNPSLVANLKRTGAKAGCSFFTILLAGFEVFLHRLTGQEDFVVGVPTAGQSFAGQENLVGHCVSVLPVKCHIDGNQSFSAYLLLRRSAILEAYEHQQFTFGSLLKKLAISGDSSRIPLVAVTFNIDRAIESKNLPFDGIEVEIFSNPRYFETFEMAVNATETEGKLVLECQYNRDLFDAETIRRRMEEFEVLLAGIVADPQQPISELPILCVAEQQLLREWNNTQTDYPKDKCIHHLFETQVELTPDAVAVVFEDSAGVSRSQLTYRELNAKANQLAHYLHKLGVGPEVLVGICVERSIDAIVGLLGILKAGGAYVPMDAQLPQERLSFMLSETKVKVLVAQQQQVEKLPPHEARVVCIDTDWSEMAWSTAIANPAIATNPDNLAYVSFTSGSTGKPKGVSVNHRGVVRLVKATNYVNLSADQIFLQLAPISFDASTFEIWGSLLNGASLAVMPPHTPTLEELGQAIRRYQVTTLWLTAGLFHLMVDERLEDLKPVRQLLAGGDVLSVPHVLKCLQELKGCRLINGYGPT